MIDRTDRTALRRRNQGRKGSFFTDKSSKEKALTAPAPARLPARLRSEQRDACRHRDGLVCNDSPAGAAAAPVQC